MHSAVYWNVVERAGIVGDVNANLINGMPTYKLRGIPVEFVQNMPAYATASYLIMHLGKLSMGAKFGEVRGGMSINRSEHVYWATDEIGFRGTERVAVKVHDIGNYHATETSRVTGPISTLLLTA